MPSECTVVKKQVGFARAQPLGGLEEGPQVRIELCDGICSIGCWLGRYLDIVNMETGDGIEIALSRDGEVVHGRGNRRNRMKIRCDVSFIIPSGEMSSAVAPGFLSSFTCIQPSWRIGHNSRDCDRI